MKKSILYFIVGPVPTPEESAEISRVEEETGLRVTMRNAQWARAGDDDFRDYIDVIGSVPSFYHIDKFFPSFEEKPQPEFFADIFKEKNDTPSEILELDPGMKDFGFVPNAQQEEDEKEVVIAKEQNVLEAAAELPPVAVSPLKKKPRGRPSTAKSKTEDTNKTVE